MQLNSECLSINKLKKSAYSVGIELISMPNASFLIATPEKALADKIAFERRLEIGNVRHMQSYLIENLRVDVSVINVVKLQSVADVYGMKKVSLLAACLRGLK